MHIHTDRHEGPTALVTVGEGKFYSNGLDLDYVGSHTDQVESFMNQCASLSVVCVLSSY
jgi:hypothetical protein